MEHKNKTLCFHMIFRNHFFVNKLSKCDFWKQIEVYIVNIQFHFHKIFNTNFKNDKN